MFCLEENFTTNYKPDEKKANELCINQERFVVNNYSCLKCKETQEEKIPVVLEEKSDIKLQFNIETVDVTIKDYSVYSTEGVKRDYYVYILDEIEKKEQKLNNASKKGDYFEATKTWRFRNISDKTYRNGYMTPDPQININSNQVFEIAVEEQSNIGKEVKDKEYFEISTTIRIPNLPGIYSRKFRLNDEYGRKISLNNVYYNCSVTFRVVPHTILSPVSGDIELGDEISGKNTSGYIDSNKMYFCNWGVYYYDRTGKLRTEKKKPRKNSHKSHYRHAWDVQALGDSDKNRCVFSISEGKVIKKQTKYGLLQIHHDYKKNEEDTTGYIAEYTHMLPESWSESSDTKKVWKEGAKVKLGTVLGRIGIQGASNYHLHFGLFPLPEKKDQIKTTVFAQIEKLNIDIPDECVPIRNLLVEDVEGPENVSTGNIAKYKATKFNIDSPIDKELKQINWIVKDNGITEIKKVLNHGKIFKFSISEELSGKTIVVMPFRKKPNENVSVKTKIAKSIIEQSNIETSDDSKSKRNFLITNVLGPKIVSTGNTAQYEANKFNIESPNDEDLQQINWAVKEGGEIINQFFQHGKIFKYTIPDNLSGKTIIVMPYRKSPTEFFSVKTKIQNSKTEHLSIKASNESKPKKIFLVKEVVGPESISFGKNATYEATKFSIDSPTDKELKQINWIIKENGKTIYDKQKNGNSLDYKISKELKGKTIIVMPYIKSPIKDVSVTTKIQN